MAAKKKQNPCIFKILDLSTAHIRRSDSFYLDNIEKVTEGRETPKYPHLVSLEHGYLFRTIDPLSYEINTEDLPYSLDLIKVLIYAHVEGCVYVRFDGDAALCPDLPTFNW